MCSRFHALPTTNLSLKVALMGHLRERYNAKARKSSRPTKRAKTVHETGEKGDGLNDDSNLSIHIPKSKETKDEERRERLRKELIEEQSNSKWTSKKKKRLEKYIDKKLKKEERVQLFEKLSQSQAQLPSILHLQSSSTLGSGKLTTNEDRLAKVEDKEVRRAIEGVVKGKKRRRAIYSGQDASSDGSEESDVDEAGANGRKDMEMVNVDSKIPGTSRESPVVVVDDEISMKDAKTNSSALQNIGIGSALRKNDDGTVLVPKVVKRKLKSQHTIFRGWGKGSKPDKTAISGAANESDSSFDSSDSSNDSHEGNGEEHTDDNEKSSGEDDTDSESNKSGSASSMCTEEENSDSAPSKRKRLGFKDWAMQQLSVAKGYVAAPSTANELSTSAPSVQEPVNVTKSANKPKHRQQEMRGPLGEDLHVPTNALAQHIQTSKPTPSTNQTGGPMKFVKITRSKEIQEARLQLPIIAEEQVIVEAIRLNPVVVICGETGSGKTTQVPQFLYEAGFGCAESDNPGMIGITQPRRVAAMSMASRVAKELSLPSSKVSYQIRYDTTTASTTAIKFMTDGVLLRELVTDFTLSRYSVIIIDEAHERSVNTDILIGVLSRIIRLREELWTEGKAKPLRLIIMSATLRVSDFAANSTLYAVPPPVVKVDARQYPVTIHFNRRTSPDYVTEAIKKACKIHARLPPGGILIFLTGQNEISGVCKKLEAKYGKKAIEVRKKRGAMDMARMQETVLNVDLSKKPSAMPTIADVEVEEMELGDFPQDNIDADDIENDSKVDPEALDTDEDEEENNAIGIDPDETEVPMHILPLYSILPTEQQMRVFETPPSNTRLVVIATNVAETSLTIPGIRYVIDCGRAKERFYDTATSVQSFRVNWISKASADQRAGRAGRTGPGHCYRLFSSALFNYHFDEFSKPEILRMPIEGVVLQMKSMHIDTVTNFPFPTPPDRLSLKKAEDLLVHLGALERPDRLHSKAVDGHITDLGKAMAIFPLSPRFAKMLISGQQHKCLPYVITIVAGLSVGDPFLREEALQTNDDGNSDSETERSQKILNIRSKAEKSKELNKLRRKAFFKSQQIHSRLGKGLSDIFRILSVVGAYEFSGGGHRFCHDNFVRPKAMEEIHKLRAQINSIASINFPGLDTEFTDKLKPPSELQVKVIRQLVCSAFIDQVAIRKDLIDSSVTSGNKYANCQEVAYRALGVKDDVFIHPSSLLYGQSPPDFVVYQELVRSNRVWLKTLTTVNPMWLATLGKRSLCTFTKPKKNSSGDLMVIPRFGPDGWELPAIKANTVA